MGLTVGMLVGLAVEWAVTFAVGFAAGGVEASACPHPHETGTREQLEPSTVCARGEKKWVGGLGRRRGSGEPVERVRRPHGWVDLTWRMPLRIFEATSETPPTLWGMKMVLDLPSEIFSSVSKY